MAISKNTSEAGSIKQRRRDLLDAQYESSIFGKHSGSKSFRDFSDFRLSSYGLLSPAGIFSEPMYQFVYNNIQESPELQALNFVSDQFKSMKRRYEDLSSKSGNYGILTVARAGMRGDRLYSSYLKELVEGFTEATYAAVGPEIVDFRAYCKKFLEFISRTRLSSLSPSGGIPISKAAYFNSSRCPQHVSGLVVDLQDYGYDDIDAISTHWRQDPNFSIYCDAALRSGFFIDKKHPFRLVADIASVPMARAAEFYGAKYSPGFGESIFESFYVPTSLTDLYEIKNTLFQEYDRLSKANPIIFNKSACGHKILVSRSKREQLSLSRKNVAQITGRKKVTTKDLLGQAAIANENLLYGLHDDRYDLLFFAKLYVLIRIGENEGLSKTLTNPEKQGIINQTRSFILEGNISNATSFIDKKLIGARKVIQ